MFKKNLRFSLSQQPQILTLCRASHSDDLRNLDLQSISGIAFYDDPGTRGVPQDTLPALRADADTPPTPSSRQAGRAPVPAQRAKSFRKLDFSGKQGFPRNSSLFKDFAIWAGTRAPPACRLEGGRGSVGIGPQGRESDLRHSARAGDIVGTDSGGPESPRVTINRNSEIFKKCTFL